MGLIELMIGITLFVIVLGAVVGWLYQANKRAVIAQENQQLERQKQTLGNLIRPDFEKAGAKLVGLSDNVYGTAAAAFLSNHQYQVIAAGEIARTAAAADETGNWIESKTQINSETGTIIATLGGESWISLTGAGGSGTIVYLSIESNPHSAQNELQVIFYAGDIKAILGAHSVGTKYRISLIPDAATGQAIVVSKLGTEPNDSGTVLYQTNQLADAFSGKKTLKAFIKNVGDRLQVTMSGAPLTSAGATAAIHPGYFVDTNLISLNQTVSECIYSFKSRRLSGRPITKHTILSGDTKTDTAYLTNLVDHPGDGEHSTIYATLPSKGEYKAGDYVLLIKQSENFAALLKVLRTDPAESGGAQIALNVTQVRDENSAWNRFIGTEEGLNAAYPPGSLIVKLNPPITYWLGENQILYREVGDRNDPVAFGVQQFSLTPETLAGGTQQYQIEVTLAADGLHTKNSESTNVARFSYAAAPRALNVANQIQ